MISLKVLLGIESAFESGWSGILRPAAAAHSEFQDKQTETPRYSIRLEAVASTREYLTGNLRRPYRWTARAVTIITTKRFVNSDQHNEMIAEAREAAWCFLTRFTDANLPYHSITAMDETAGTRSHDTEDETDTTVIHHDIIIEIRQKLRSELAQME